MQQSISTIKEDGSLEETQPAIVFNIPGSTCVTSLTDSFICAKVSVKKKDDDDGSLSAPASTEHVTVCNNTLYSMFRDMVITLNDRQIQSSYQCYHIFQYLNLLLNTSETAMSKWLCASYYNDTNLTQV